MTILREPVRCLALNSVWDPVVLPALQRAATPSPAISFEVTEADRRALPEGYTPTENWREGTPGRRTFACPTVHQEGEGGIGGFDFRDRGKARGCGGTDMDGVACACHLNAHPEEAKEVEDLVFVFLDSEVEGPYGDRKVTIVFRGGVRWIMGRDCLDGHSWGRNYRPVRSSTPAVAGK